MRRINFLVATIILLFPLTVGAVPQLLKHQGYMSDDQGEPATGSANLTFNLYSVESEGESAWTQTIAVTFEVGFYKVVLGPGEPELSLALFDGADVYLGVTLEGETEFMPRMKLASVPHAFKAEAVEGEVKAVGGLVVDGVEVINDQQEWVGTNISFNDLADIPEDLADGDDIGMEGSGTDGTLAQFSESGMADSLMVISDGKLGIGTDSPMSAVQIAGSVQIADDSGDCVEGKAGTLRWHEDQIEVCDGNSWGSLGYGSPDGQTPQTAGLSCKGILDGGRSVGDDFYWIAPPGFENDPFEVYCDQTLDGGGWTIMVGTYYSAHNNGVAHNCGASACGDIREATTGSTGSPGGRFKLSDDQIRAVISMSTNAHNADYLWNQIGWNDAYSTGNYEYATITNYTGEWHFDRTMGNSQTTATLTSYKRSDNSIKWQGNLPNTCTNGIAGINCVGGIGGNVPGVCNENLGRGNWSGNFYFYMAEHNDDNYLYFCNGPQHTSSNRYKARYFVRERN